MDVFVEMYENKLDGEIVLRTYEGENGPIVCIYGTPDGLRSPSAKLELLAAIDQTEVPARNLPPDEGIHFHIKQIHGLDARSCDVDLGRLDAKASGDTSWYK